MEPEVVKDSIKLLKDIRETVAFYKPDMWEWKLITLDKTISWLKSGLNQCPMENIDD